MNEKMLKTQAEYIVYLHEQLEKTDNHLDDWKFMKEEAEDKVEKLEKVIEQLKKRINGLLQNK